MAHGLNRRRLSQTVAEEAGRKNCAPLAKSELVEMRAYAGSVMSQLTDAELAQSGAHWRKKDGCVSAPVNTPTEYITGRSLAHLSLPTRTGAKRC